MSIGKRIKERREALNIERATLARSVGIHYQTLAGLENEDQHSTTRLHRIAEELRCNVDWLESGRGPIEPTASTPTDTETLRREVVALGSEVETLRQIIAGLVGGMVTHRPIEAVAVARAITAAASARSLSSGFAQKLLGMIDAHAGPALTAADVALGKTPPAATTADGTKATARQAAPAASTPKKRRRSARH